MAEDTALIAKKHKRKKVLLIVGVVVLVVLAAGAGVALRWWQSQDADQTTPTPMLPEVAGELQGLRDSGQSDAAIDEAINKALDNPSLDAESRYYVYLQQGQTLYDRKQWQPAIDAYLKAEALRQTYEVAELLAEAYRQAGQTEQAIAYYNKAITLISPNNPRKEAVKSSLEYWIHELEAQQ